MPELVIGSVPRKDDYFGRQNLIDSIWEKLDKDNILLIAPRRYGKTGAMYKLLDEPHEQFKPFYISVEHIMSASDFMIELAAGLMHNKPHLKLFDLFEKGAKKTAGYIRNLPGEVEIGDFKIKLREHTPISEQWKSFGSKIMSLVEKDDPVLLILIDEFAIMIDVIAKRDKKEAEELLRWFRSTRNAPNTKTKFVIGGSTNLISTLQKYGLVDTINDLFLIKLHPFDEKTAKKYITAIFDSKGISLDKPVLERIIELVGSPMPYILAVFLSAIFDRLHSLNGNVTTDIVNEAFEKDLLEGGTSAVFQHYWARIAMYYSDEEKEPAKKILRTLALTEDGAGRDTLFVLYLRSRNIQPDEHAQEEFEQVMEKLENDFYIIKTNGKYDFLSRVLKIWWKNKYGFSGE